MEPNSSAIKNSVIINQELQDQEVWILFYPAITFVRTPCGSDKAKKEDVLRADDRRSPGTACLDQPTQGVGPVPT